MHSFVNRGSPLSILFRSWRPATPRFGEMFLCAVFHRWVREDIGRINILLFSETLSAWCGETLTQPGAPAANSTCYGCPWLRLCRCGEQEDPLCAGYRQFYDFSGPYMRVMRDLRRQQRPPEALMPLLR
ncbi:Putative transcriptional regulator [Klebsiella pneumoniae]|nr:Putative transcriptional regulator [Klebsiella pneumoniae]